MLKLRSSARRPVHLGPWPVETLARADRAPDLAAIPPTPQVRFDRGGPLVAAMRDSQAMLDLIRDGAVTHAPAEIPGDPVARADHLKAFAHYCDASMVGIARLAPAARRAEPHRNPDVARLADILETREAKTFASGIDAVLAGLREAMATPLGPIEDHRFALVILHDFPRDPRPDEPGADWIRDAQAQRACLRAAEVAVVLASYLRLLGHPARAHSGAASDVDLGRLAVAAGLVAPDGAAPWIGRRFGLAAVTTTLDLAPDRPLARPGPGRRAVTHGPIWWAGPQPKTARTADPYRRRDFRDGPHPFETLRRTDAPTTYIDEPNVARVPKRADMFARALFGDMGKPLQEAAKGGGYVRKSAAAFAFRGALAALTALQNAPPEGAAQPLPADRAADLVKAASYFLGLDAVGISRCPDWAYYSHNAAGDPLAPYHGHAVSMIVDQGFETMEGASGDDWIACAQSMRAYLRFSLLGGVMAQMLRSIGWEARVHSVMDGEVLQPPLLLLSGLGEVSRIGEVILNPFLGPRLKSGVVTTNLPMRHDRPVDFGLQRFCEACNKCARECPSGAITAGPKRMFNGYEIWKSDSQKCTTYRVTQAAGAMCGRCMKTCPWNLEGLFAEAPVRWAAIHVPRLAPALARLDDALGRGSINPVKRWWWPLELRDGAYRWADGESRRQIAPDLRIRAEDQTMAVYPAPLAPPPHPYPAPMDREAGIAAHAALISAEEHRARRARGAPPEHLYRPPADAPVRQVRIARAEPLTDAITLYDLAAEDPLPPFAPGAHIDVVVAPEYLRPYSLCGDPAGGRYQIAVLREDDGRGGSALAHRIFRPGRSLFVSLPIDHFPLDEGAAHAILLGGGIGITPLIPMAHRLHALGRSFALHYCVTRRADLAFGARLAAQPWADRVAVHISEEGTRADLPALLTEHRPGWHVYTCGPGRFMQAVLEAAAHWPENAVHLEHFAVPDLPEAPRHPFALRLRDGRTVQVAADQSAAEALQAAGVPVDVKCADGLCGVCRCTVLAGEVDHRDHVLSAAQRQTAMITCRSRAAQPGGTLALDL